MDYLTVLMMVVKLEMMRESTMAILMDHWMEQWKVNYLDKMKVKSMVTLSVVDMELLMVRLMGK